MNLPSLAIRRPKLTLDTCIQQVMDYGFFSYAKPSSYAPHIVFGAAQFCYERRAATDAIIITGDLATTGHQLDIAVARNYATANASDGFTTASNRPTLQASKLPLWVLPGNHDKYSDNFGTPKSRNFELSFHGLMPNYRNSVGHKVRQKNGHHLGIVFADFCLRERADASNKFTGPFGQGRVYTDVLHELESRTRYLRDKYPGLSLIWAIHFAPYDCGAALALLDWTLVAKSAQMHQVAATLCGHTHVASVFKSSGHTTYCAGSAGAIDQEETSSIHIIRVAASPQRNVSRANYQWSSVRGEFYYSHDD